MASMSGSASISSYDPIAPGMPRPAATARARSASREAIAVTAHRRACCMAGITLVVPMFAVLKMPQRSVPIH